MRRRYVGHKFRTDALEMIATARSICADYASQGYDLTLRQLYYQFVSRDLIANKQSEYKRLGGIINDARLAGLLDWDYIVDRTRNLEENTHWDSPKAIIDGAARSYLTDRWANQLTRVEVWIEKDALVGVLESCCPREDVAFFSCRGYTSQSEIWGAAQRLGGYLRAEQGVVILHLGDHDPSGIDMTRDITDRLNTFLMCDMLHHLKDEGEINVSITGYREVAERLLTERVVDRFEVKRIALNMDQVEEYDPPPNPAKLTDSRADSYIREHGSSSWELDALEPTVLVGLIRNAIHEHRDDDLWEEATHQQEAERKVLKATSNRWDEVERFLS